MIRHRAVTSILLLASLACARLAPVADFPPLRAAPDLKRTHAAILAGLHTKRWTIAGETPGVIVARLPVRDHVAEVRITYDREWVRFEYHGSESLDYRADTRRIHPAYNTWVARLRGAIASELSFAATVREPDDVDHSPAP